MGTRRACAQHARGACWVVTGQDRDRVGALVLFELRLRLGQQRAQVRQRRAAVALERVRRQAAQLAYAPLQVRPLGRQRAAPGQQRVRLARLVLRGAPAAGCWGLGSGAGLVCVRACALGVSARDPAARRAAREAARPARAPVHM